MAACARLEVIVRAEISGVFISALEYECVHFTEGCPYSSLD